MSKRATATATGRILPDPPTNQAPNLPSSLGLGSPVLI